jgi:PEGA domain
MSIRTVAILALALTTVSVARAEVGKRTVLVPQVAHDPAEVKLAALVEPALIDAAKKVGAFELVNLEGGKLRGPARVDAKADPRPQTRAQALIREHNAELAIIAEPQALVDGAVVYLQVIAIGGAVRGSTTVALDAATLSAGGAALERVLQGGLIQIIDPAHFAGRVELHVDVHGAQIEVDGRNAPAAGAVTTLTLPVGTHAVRVTHPAYHDYMRFIDVAYDQTRVENAALSAFPLTEGEMDERRRRAPAPKVKVKWYRSWWALALTGAVVTGATIGIVFGARASISADHTVHYEAQPTP